MPPDPSASYELALQPGTSPAQAGVPDPVHSVVQADGMRIERNRPVAMRDGVEILVDVFRPLGDDRVPVLVAWSPYGKHNGIEMYQLFVDERGTRGGGVKPEWLSKYTGFEGPDPQHWCAHGYAVIKVDPRGLWWSAGEFASILGETEARDVYDLIEWAGTQPWSTGRVGMTGASYLAMIQWWAASLQPPHLAAINPCEGVTDMYREFCFHGGIPDSGFPRLWQTQRLKYSTSAVEACADMMASHPFDDAYWAGKRADLEQITVPAYVVASWSDQGLHTRGTLSGYERISSEHKYLEVHGRKKWEYYHQPESVARQMLFFDRFLKGSENESADWPPVRLEVRESFYQGAERAEERWPPGQISHQALYLDGEHLELSPNACPTATRTVSYDSEQPGEDAVFAHVFERDTDVIGAVKLKLWVEADGAEDMDLFVGLQKLDRNGRPVMFPFANVLEDGPVALGWLRVSHRELDAQRSLPERPHHRHQSRQLLAPGEVVPVEVEIWPSATHFSSDETLALVIRGSDLYTVALLSRHAETENRGRHILHCGGEYDSHLLIPLAR